MTDWERCLAQEAAEFAEAEAWDECNYSYLIHTENGERTMKKRESYMFRQPCGDRLSTVVIAKPGRTTREVEITPSTYNRFAALANSGDYALTIESSDYGIAWQLRRPL